jgi:hypothetical protein
VRARVADLAIKISQHEHGVRSENDPEVCWRIDIRPCFAVPCQIARVNFSIELCTST